MLCMKLNLREKPKSRPLATVIQSSNPSINEDHDLAHRRGQKPPRRDGGQDLQGAHAGELGALHGAHTHPLRQPRGGGCNPVPQGETGGIRPRTRDPPLRRVHQRSKRIQAGDPPALGDGDRLHLLPPGWHNRPQWHRGRSHLHLPPGHRQSTV